MTQPGAIFRDGHMVEQTVDHGDGTGTRTVYNEAGQVVSTGAVTGLPVERAEDRNARTIEDRLRSGLDANKAYLAIATPTAAQQRAQLARLTRQNTALIRRLLRDLTDTSDT
ncbi:MAG: hypothetical protein KA758_07525 [Acidimicrobiales bacterium]|nr:hypothetical protein [Acidimicrobiales bacterium]